MYTCNIEKNVLEKTRLYTQLLKTCLFETLFPSKRNQTCIVNELSGFYAIFNIDKNSLNWIFFEAVSYDNLMYIMGRHFEGRSVRNLIFGYFWSLRKWNMKPVSVFIIVTVEFSLFFSSLSFSTYCCIYSGIMVALCL